MNENKGHILVIDDEPEILNFVSELLKGEGYQVTTAADGDDAWKLIDSETTYNLILSDIQMPKLDGIKLLNKILYKYPFKVVVFMTAFNTYQEEELYKKGVCGYLEKPFTVERLLEMVEKNIKGPNYFVP